ncbi:hypothetical protein Syun_025495 [Stephania yunnanensis]|uniref:Histone-lysine N-methyltransferase n=1 Tax=Stephania yunnanensis TaxID=152371 RepID=A0AAP0EUD6_9MAGN
MSKSSDMFQMVDPFVGLARSDQPCSYVATQNVSQMGQSVLEKTASGVMQRQRNVQEGCDIFHRSLTGGTQNILPNPSDVQTRPIIKESAHSGGFASSRPLSEKGQADNAYQSISDYINFLTRGGSAFVPNQNLGNFKLFGSDSDVDRSNSSRDAFSTDRDAIPSNIELRLGQPSQQNCTLKGSVLSAVPSQHCDGLLVSEKSPFPASVIHGNPRFSGESRQNLLYAPRDNSRGQNQSQSNIARCSNGSSHVNAIDIANLERLNGDTAKSSLISMFLSNSEMKNQPHVVSNVVNGDPALLRMPICESHVAHKSLDFPKSRSDERLRQVNITGLGPLNNLDKDKGLHGAFNCAHTTENRTSLVHNKHVVGLSHFPGGVGENILLSGSNGNDNRSYVCQSSCTLLDPTDVNNLPNQLKKASFLESSSHIDHGHQRSLHFSSPTDGPSLPMPAVSMSFSSTTSVCRQNTSLPLAIKEGDVNPQTVDENLKLFALRQLLDFSKLEHVASFHKIDPRQERVSNLSTMEMQRPASTSDPPSADLKDGTCFLTKQDASEASVKHLACPVDGVEKSANVSAVNNRCNSSSSSRPISLFCVESDIQCPHSFGPIHNKQPMARVSGERMLAGSLVGGMLDWCQKFGRNETDRCTTLEHETCNQAQLDLVPEKHSCDFQSVSLSENCACGDKAPIIACNGHIGRRSTTTPALFPSVFGKVCKIPSAKTNATCQGDNSTKESPVQKDCQASQWRDVPRQQKGSHAPCIERPAEEFNIGQSVEEVPVETISKVLVEKQEVESLNEQQMSNAFSGCSAPAVTELTGEVNNVGSCTVNAQDVRNVGNHIFDEGSGIAKSWSSDETFDCEKSTDTVNGSNKLGKTEKGCVSSLSGFSSQSLDDCETGSVRLKKMQNQSHNGRTVYKITGAQKLDSDLKVGKRKKPTKWKRLDASFPITGLSSVNYESANDISQDGVHLSSSYVKKITSNKATCHPKYGSQKSCSLASNGCSNLKRKRSVLNSTKILSAKRNQDGFHDYDGDWQNYSQKQSRNEARSCRNSKLLGEKRLRWCYIADSESQLPSKEINQVIIGKASMDISAESELHSFSSTQTGTYDKQPRPIVCGNSGIISDGKVLEGRAKPIKLVSLSTILRKAKRCSVIEQEEPWPSLMLETKKSCFVSEDDDAYEELSVMRRNGESGCSRPLKKDVLQSFSSASLKAKVKKVRLRSLDELSCKRNKFSSAKFYLRNSLKCSFLTKQKLDGKFYSLKRIDDSLHYRDDLCEGITKIPIKDNLCQSSILNSDAFCCVCGSSNKDDINSLLECNGCSIRVHQACYGVMKVPKVRWYCRPCGTNSKNIVCVLCGYGGGAMTQALKSQNIVKSFLKAWNFADISKSGKSILLSEVSGDEFKSLHVPNCKQEINHVSSMRLVAELSSLAVLKTDWVEQTDVIKGAGRNPVICNSITSGALDSTTKQWVHMVCGLWTPGTRCPNVHTMSAFDVSGASHPPKDTVCSMCNRFGGSYIQCRVLNCNVRFHPWCAHQKGLLQSEVEGADDEKVGFYGRCMLHATHIAFDLDNDPVDSKYDGEKEDFKCARTEGYKGRKKDGCRNIHYGQSKNRGCFVPQEQINAWLHIIGHKSSTRGLLKPQASEIEYDCRKEYARYKQAKGWKHLVVYKSGIHALGLYTSQFIPRGAMVVEYVGEIVGLRVADKREIEYQSGRRLQYKSACYFFRIDKEHIIDATRKGGIARFVNHSCLPNCIAKVISVRNEKKVVFFAERDINQGEEITYDYHFNHEDEGKKIPCFCNSKNCRRYLN